MNTPKVFKEVLLHTLNFFKKYTLNMYHNFCLSVEPALALARGRSQGSRSKAHSVH